MGILAASLLLAGGTAAVYFVWNSAFPPPYAVEASAGTRWDEHLASGVHRMRLEEGTLSIHVARSAGEPRLIVEVPDGEIRDIGTRFTVTVADGRTRAIRVQEGAVEFLRRHGSLVEVKAGAAWLGAAPEAPVTPSASGEIAAPNTAPPERSARQGGATTATKETPQRPRGGAPSESTGKSSPSEVSQNDDHTGEDLQYLHVLALVREGRVEEARLAAQDYLRRFPHGFRRIEVEEVAR